MAYCGLDFGTSNSTLGVVNRPGAACDSDDAAGHGARLLPLEGEAVTLPSAIFFDPMGQETVGRAGIQAYADGLEGRLMRSLKSVLGTDLLDQETQLGRRRIGFREVLTRLLSTIKARGEAAAGQPLDCVVHGRPVNFVDGDPAADQRAEDALADIARAIGFREVSFQFEPIAAALDYEQQVAAEEIALIADIGGGTSDFSVVRLGPRRRRLPDRAADILASSGLRVGGVDFDRLLSLHGFMPTLGYQSPLKRAGLLAPNTYFTDLSTWSRINFLYTAKVAAELRQLLRESAAPEKIDRLVRVVEEHYGHRLAMTVESTKIGLSGEGDQMVALPWLESGLNVAVTRAEFETATADPAAGIGAAIARCLQDAGVVAAAIDAVFLTGGSTLLPHVRAAILATVPEARVVDGDKFGSVGLGLTLEATRRYG